MNPSQFNCIPVMLDILFSCIDTPIVLFAASIMGFRNDTTMNCALPEAFCMRLATFSAFTPSRNISISSNA